MRPYAFPVLVLAFLASTAASVSATCGPDADPAMSVTSVKLVITGFATEQVDDGFRLDAVLAPGTIVDPATSGLSLELSNTYAGTFASANVPGGVGWRVRARGAASFSDPGGTHGGITRIKLKPLADGTLAISIAGRREPYALSTSIRPVRLTVGFGPAATGPECGVAHLSYSRCGFPVSGNAMRCTPPPAPRRCGETPDARVRCDALNAAAAQEAYFVAHGEYLGGDCSELPGFTASPETICVTAGSELAFVLTTAGPSASITCTYESAPVMDDPSLVCS